MPKADYIYDKIGYPGGERFMGNGLVTEISHDKWKIRRDLFNQGFNKKYKDCKSLKGSLGIRNLNFSVLSNMITEFNSKADILVTHLKKKADGKTEIRLLDEFNHTALDIIASVRLALFSVEVFV